MKPAALAFLLILPLAPAQAQDNPSLMEEGAKLFFEGLLQEMHPAPDELRALFDQFGPALRDFADLMGPALLEVMAFVDDIGNYEMPEFLPNGDIIIRRSPDAPPFTPPATVPEITDL